MCIFRVRLTLELLSFRHRPKNSDDNGLRVREKERGRGVPGEKNNNKNKEISNRHTNIICGWKNISGNSTTNTEYYKT